MKTQNRAEFENDHDTLLVYDTCILEKGIPCYNICHRKFYSQVRVTPYLTVLLPFIQARSAMLHLHAAVVLLLTSAWFVWELDVGTTALGLPVTECRH